MAYKFRDKEEVKPKRSEAPVWRALGCVTLIVVPAVFFFIGGAYSYPNYVLDLGRIVDPSLPSIPVFGKGPGYDSELFVQVRAGLPDRTVRLALFTFVPTILTLSLFAAVYGLATIGQFSDPAEKEMQDLMKRRQQQRKAKGRKRRMKSR